jgi:hypothetical protein
MIQETRLSRTSSVAPNRAAGRDARRVLSNADRSDELVDCELGGRNRAETEGFTPALKSLIGRYLDQQRICCWRLDSPSGPEMRWTMIIANIETLALRIPFKKGVKSDASA